MAGDDTAPLSAAQFKAGLAALKADILEQARQIAVNEAVRVAEERQPPKNWLDAGWRLIWLSVRFFSSGLFFIGIGAIILLIASDSSGTTHSSITFVLVVLGVAITLYGTGTQGMGRFDSATNAGKYNVAIAGGAGVLAFCVALGMIHYYPQMQNAFQVEKKYVRVLIGPAENSSDLTQYIAQFSIDGLSIPSVRIGRIFEVLVPFNGTDLTIDKALAKPDSFNHQPGSDIHTCIGANAQNTSSRVTGPQEKSAVEKIEESKSIRKTILAEFYRVNGAESSAQLGPPDPRYYYVRINQENFEGGDGAFDFPKYAELMCVTLTSTIPVAAQLRNTGNRPEKPAPDAKQILQATPPAVPFGDQP